ncbi:MAG: hypothetical protein ACT4PO_11320 [Actinomycetota bacterium]
MATTTPCYYFYVFDRDFGPAFIKVSTYFPYPVRVGLNGHEWLKRQLDRAGVAYSPLDNGIASCSDPARAQAMAEKLSAPSIEAFFARWVRRLPWPFIETDRAAGYRHHLSVLQFEYSLTLAFDRPLTARRLVERLIRDNLDLGRPHEVSIVFGRRINRSTPGTYRTRLVDREGLATLSFTYKDACRVKEYLKEGQAFRIETTINNPTTVGILKGIAHLPELVALGRQINRRMIDVQRAAQQCIPVTARFEQVCLPSTHEGLRAPGLRFGDRLVLGLLGALSLFCHVPEGLTNESLRRAVQGLTGIARSSRQASYDLRRLGLNGLIVRIPRTHSYQVTELGRMIGAIYTRTFERVIGMAEHAMSSEHDCAHPLAMAWRRLDHEFDRLVCDAGLQRAA